MSFSTVLSFTGGRATINADTLAELSRKFRDVIESRGFGASAVRGSDLVFQDGVVLGRISYNGRIWPPTTGDWRRDLDEQTPIYDNRGTV
jgi:hypothetical protein